MGRALQGKMLPSPLVCWAVHHPSAPCHLHISAGKSKSGSVLICLAGKKKKGEEKISDGLVRTDLKTEWLHEH